VKLETLRRLRWWLDEAFRVPGTSIRFGWDPIIGLVPWAGDLLTALLACAIVLHAHRMRLPRIVQLRMLLNIAIDLVVGAVPVVGDAADVVWKSNSMNMALIERHAAEVRPASAGDWLFVGGVIAAILAVAAVPLLVMYWLVSSMIKRW
jgi:uncharacterized protein DUF4112